MKLKVLAYITRIYNGQAQLLVFDHRDYVEAGTQVPAGTVEPSEDIEHALFREIEEESGLPSTQLTIVSKLGEFENRGLGIVRHVFHLAVKASLQDRWSHTVGGTGEDSQMVFNYYWLNLKPNIELVNKQSEWLSLISV